MAYWVTFTDRASGSVEIHPGEDPALLAAQFGTVQTIDRIPYPARPELRNVTGCPPFCRTPEVCKGRGSCPKSYACSE